MKDMHSLFLYCDCTYYCFSVLTMLHLRPMVHAEVEKVRFSPAADLPGPLGPPADFPLQAQQEVW